MVFALGTSAGTFPASIRPDSLVQWTRPAQSANARFVGLALECPGQVCPENSRPIGASNAETGFPGRIPWGECFFYFFTYPVALCFFACLLAFLGTALESTFGLPVANRPAFLLFFIPGAFCLLILILRDLQAHSRLNPQDVTE